MSLPTKTTVIHYEELTAVHSRAEIRAYRDEAKTHSWGQRKNGVQSSVFLMIVLACVCLPGVWIIFDVGLFDTFSPIALIFSMVFFGTLALALLVILRAVLKDRGRWLTWLRMTAFAEANGLDYLVKGEAPAYPGAIFRIGTERVASDQFTRKAGRPLRFGNYNYVTGSGKSRKAYAWGFLALKLDRPLPHMVLDSKANNGLFGGTNLPDAFDRKQVLPLEGDFDEYFTLYCPREYETDALYVFTPDLMALLIDNASPFDVEIVDDWMFLYSAKPFDLTKQESYERLFRAVDTVGTKTVAQGDNYRDERSSSAGTIASQGSRLKKAFPIFSVIGGMLALGFALWGWFDTIAGWISDWMS